MKKLILSFVLLALCMPALSEPVSEARIKQILPGFEAYVEKARKEWDVPSAAVAVIHKDKILWWKGFGERGGGISGPPDLNTVFAVGSTTKAFCSTTQAMMVDGGGPDWDSRVADQVHEFQMADPWVTREMRVHDLLAQHPGIAKQALSTMGGLGYSPDDIVRALRWAPPVSSFRTKFAYVNALHIVAGRMVAQWAGAESWQDVLTARILKPLGMTRTSWTPEGLDGDPNRAPGHAWVKGKVRALEAGPFPYQFGPAGGLNSTLADMSNWLRLQLGRGEFEGKRLVSAENLAYTWTPQTVLNSENFYCLGWILHYWDGHSMLWHNGGVPGHTTFVGFQPDEQLGIVILSNLGGTQMPDAVGIYFFEEVHGKAKMDYSAAFLERNLQGQKATEEFRRSPAGAKPAPAASKLTGRYTCEALGDLVVENQGGQLYLNFTKPGEKAHLIPHDGLSFRLVFEQGWMSRIGWEEGGSVLFTTDTEGVVDGLQVRLGEPDEGAVLPATKN